VAIKECSGDARRLAAIVNATEDFEVLVGGDDWALEGFCAGATGWISGVVNVAPRECVELFRLCSEGRLDEARAVYARILPLARLDMHPKLVQFFKAAMDLAGREGGPCRPPRLELTAEDYADTDRWEQVGLGRSAAITQAYLLDTDIVASGDHHLRVARGVTGDDLVELAQNKKIILTAGYIERYNPVVQDVKRIIQGKKYGEPMMMEFHRENRMPAHITDVGIIYDTSVHDIDTAMYLFDSKPIVVFARTGKKFHAFEDFATIMLGFEDQRVAIIASNWITPKRVRRFSAVCTDGIITGDFISQEIRIDDMDATTIPRREFKEPLSVEITSFLGAVAGNPQ
jgi:hypothetical protein